MGTDEKGDGLMINTKKGFLPGVFVPTIPNPEAEGDDIAVVVRNRWIKLVPGQENENTFRVLVEAEPVGRPGSRVWFYVWEKDWYRIPYQVQLGNEFARIKRYALYGEKP